MIFTTVTVLVVEIIINNHISLAVSVLNYHICIYIYNYAHTYLLTMLYFISCYLKCTAMYTFFIYIDGKYSEVVSTH